jgi:Asp-tRNA(Asn)/Glu-tRNA(Gln) amidotransferase A subunit family amidase
MRDGRVTSRELVTQYLARIGLYENRVNAAISVSASALAEADALAAASDSGPS